LFVTGLEKYSSLLLSNIKDKKLFYHGNYQSILFLIDFHIKVSAERKAPGADPRAGDSDVYINVPSGI
jgi:hypothetical protein